MKRIVLWLLSTLSVLVLLFGYHTSTDSSLATNPPTSIVTDDTGSADAASSSESTSGTTTVSGDAVSTQWGPVQVELTVEDGAITAVDVVQYPQDNPRDVEINAYAIPTLVQETLDQQSADIDMVSGATVTSVGYLQSLQSALDRAGL
ncbi:FMN-binding protein [Nocardioides sp.]|uniref:FMN-binding protein n=1 Tax=Nocardioides sp. TaxID=35761 RepID=UPI002EDB3B56